MDASVLSLIDGSEGARRAVRFAAQLAGRSNACLVVVAPVQVPYVPRPAMVSVDTAQQIRAEARSDILEIAARELKAVREDPNIEVSAEYRIVEIERDLALEVTALLFEGHFRALVLPRAGISGLRPWRMDVVSEIVKQSPVPVTLVP